MSEISTLVDIYIYILSLLIILDNGDKIPDCYYQAYIFYKLMGPKKWHMNLVVTQDTQYSKVIKLFKIYV